MGTPLQMQETAIYDGESTQNVIYFTGCQFQYDLCLNVLFQTSTSLQAVEAAIRAWLDSMYNPPANIPPFLYNLIRGW